MMIKHPDAEIVQIIPAPAWWAVYKVDDDEEGDIWVPLACWALTDQGEVVGVAPEELGLSFADGCSNFDRYEYDPHRKAKWLMK
jgi:hypothetical protein